MSKEDYSEIELKGLHEEERVGGRRLSHIVLQSRDSTWTLPIRGPHADVVEVCVRENSKLKVDYIFTNTEKKRERERNAIC